MLCPKCGRDAEDDRFCWNCSYELTKEEEAPITKDLRGKNPHLLAIILGYIFAFLSPIIGLIFSIYILTREKSKADFHAKIILAISVFMIFIVFISKIRW